MIELTKEEVQAVINTLLESPAKYSIALIQFFSAKLKAIEDSKNKTTNES